MNKISDVLTVISFILFIVIKIFENNNYSMASLLCGAIFIWKGRVFVGEGIWFENICKKEETKIP